MDELREHVLGQVNARLEESVARENAIRQMIQVAKDEKAATDAKIEAERETLYGKAKAAVLDILRVPEPRMPKRQRAPPADDTPPFMRALQSVKCEDFDRDPCKCAETEGCGYDHKECKDEMLGACRDVSVLRDRLGIGVHRKLTSCLECATLKGCPLDDVWTRIGASIQKIVPKIRIFKDRAHVDLAVLSEGYQWGDPQGLPSDSDIEKGDTPICAAVHFRETDGDYSLDATVQLNATATLRSDLSLLDSTYRWVETYRFRRFNGYTSGGPADLIAIQKFLENFVLEKAGIANLTQPLFVPFPTDASVRFGWIVVEPMSLAGLCRGMHLSSFIIAICFAVTVFRERITHIRDGLQMMGLTDMGYYLAVYCFFGTWILIPTGLAIAWIWLPPPFVVDRGESEWGDWETFYPGSNFIYLWWCYWWNMMTIFMMTLFFGCFTNRRPVSIIASYVLIDFSVLVPFTVISPAMTWIERFGLSAFIPVASMFQTFHALRELLILGAPLTWDSLFVRTYHNGAWSVGDGCVMLPVSFLIWCLMYMYADQVLTAPTTRKWHFPVTFWLPTKKLEDDNEPRIAPNPKFFETTDMAHLELERQSKCVIVEDLVKTFHAHGLTTKAVQGLSLTLYEGEIFCLLGHNGAGKTTAISCLTGIITQTSGTASAFGMPLDEFRVKHRKEVGFCPQHSVLWMELTCLQHLMTFARYKGFDTVTALAEAHDVLDQLGMSRKAHAKAKQLSGGMQRKLSLGIAFVCNPRLVFLDEPSSGMDATARQECWDFLRSRREKTIILLTTHYMDEADCLGDRVMVMSAGAAKCCGTGQFLKSAFNCGYMIRCLLFDENCDEAAKSVVVNVVERHLGGPVSGKTGTGAELNLTVRMDQAGTFAAMFPELDVMVREKKMKEWSVAVCSLEEVFLRVAGGWTGDDGGDKHEEKAAVQLPQTKRGQSKFHLQIQAMLTRRAHYMKRSWLYLLCQTAAPVMYILLIFTVIGGFIATILGSGELAVSMDTFNDGLKAADPDFAETIPVLAIPMGDGFKDGTLESHGLASSFSIDNTNYELKMAELTIDEYWTDCDDERLDQVWEDAEIEREEEELEAEIAYNESLENPGACAELERRRGGRRPRDDRLRQLLSKFKTPGELASCAVGDYLVDGEPHPNITDVEAITRGFSCWLKKARDADDHPHSTYGAIMLYGVNQSQVVLVNTTGLHTVPIMLNVRSNALLQKVSPDDKITFIFSVFERTPMEFGNLRENIFTRVGIVLLGVAFSFPPPFFVAFIVEEKATGVKGQMLVSGVTGLNYWISNYIFDIIPWGVALSLITLTYWSYDLTLFFKPGVFEIYMASMGAFIVHQIPLAYVLGMLFNDPSTAIITVLLTNFVLAIIFITWNIGMERIP
jgi:ABC-type multidrug transport system ATPase subunit